MAEKKLEITKPKPFWTKTHTAAHGVQSVPSMTEFVDAAIAKGKQALAKGESEHEKHS